MAVFNFHLSIKDENTKLKLLLVNYSKNILSAIKEVEQIKSKKLPRQSARDFLKESRNDLSRG
ncbi:hypothetical protein DTX80_17530 [Bacilli bacterium]|uniref:hypothetical protein n=1 Tax=Oceanobacillus TaxID=182709 RepID=UPI0006210928|nr:hypothetical protein WH51_14205 [Bacilli bacterium VT-13-104]PZD83273.1 hypothetical protein DEJ64_15505 [Bacilli bacterium]PZD84457.1 hypothetical protein DEJ60_14585 [Bacilli bacterium]PZD86675.1 hypothetical protein DEJ66_15145 [Bacilli bacterium]RCO04337.1 hypothetical protein DTX80_17530 [Bacilli bacterium]